MITATGNIIALDVGERRIGVAVAHSVARLPRPLTTIERTEAVFRDIQNIINEEDVKLVVVGLPRGLNGQETRQTEIIRQFVTALRAHTPAPVELQDEALTSHKAEAELQLKNQAYKKGMVDSLAATYILEDYLMDHRGLN